MNLGGLGVPRGHERILGLLIGRNFNELSTVRAWPMIVTRGEAGFPFLDIAILLEP